MVKRFTLLPMVTLLRFCILLMFMSSCFRPNCGIRDFSAYKIPKDKEIQVNGIYVSTNHRGAFFLYENGMCRFFPVNAGGPEFWSEPAKGVNWLKSLGQFHAKENWGRYVINNEDLIIQNFNRNGETFCKRWLFEERGYIENDSTIIIQVSESIKSGGIDTIFAGKNIYRFYPMDIKPDSTIAWFLEKNWYKRGMEEANP